MVWSIKRREHCSIQLHHSRNGHLKICAHEAIENSNKLFSLIIMASVLHKAPIRNSIDLHPSTLAKHITNNNVWGDSIPN